MKNKRIKILIALMVITAMAVTGFTVSYAEDGTQENIIDRIELANDVKPVEGEMPAEPEVPADAQYSVDEYQWFVVSGDTAESVEGAFKSGELYELAVLLVSNEGYKISETPAVPTPDGCTKADYEPPTDGMIFVIYTFPLPGADTIPVVEIKDVDAPYLGEHPDHEYTIPEGAGYSVQGPPNGLAGYRWYRLDRDTSAVNSISRHFMFDERYDYYLQVFYKPDEGKKLSPLTLAALPPGFDRVETEYEESSGFLCVEYHSAAKAPSLIETLDLTGLRSPEAGETPEDMTIPENDKFSIEEKVWFRIDEDGNRTDIGSGETFKAGETCGLILLIEPKHGYIFDENADVVPEALKEHIVFSEIDDTSAFISMSFNIPEPEDPNGQTEPADPTGSDQNVNDEEAADGDQAETGDESSVMPWILLMAGALAGAVIILRKRRHN